MIEGDRLLSGFLDGNPASVAIVHHGREFTRGELARSVDELAQGLSRELEEGEVLALWLPNGPEILCLHLACFASGVVPMPLAPGLKWSELESILRLSRVSTLVTSAELAALHERQLAELGLRVWCAREGGVAFGARPGQARTLRSRELDAERPTLILHTSGSSGVPKGVVLSRRALRHILEYRLSHTELGPSSVAVVASCVSQSVGLYQCLAYLAAGAKLVLLDSYELEPLAEAVAHFRPTHLIMVVAAFDQLLHHPRITPETLAELRFACAGADRLTERVQARFIELAGRPLCSSYGLTESSWALVNLAQDPTTSLALGKPCPGAEVRLLGSDGCEVAPGDVGEIQIRSPRNLLGYLHDAPATRRVLVDGWLTTGDLAYRDRAGYFWFVGRSKEVIVLASGDNVAPKEVEDVLLTHPSVAACMVVGKTTAGGSQVPWAFVRSSSLTSPEALQSFLRERLSDFKVPEGIEFVTELPLGLSGKIQRRSAFS